VANSGCRKVYSWADPEADLTNCYKGDGSIDLGVDRSTKLL
jgi:hypothetical protein